MNDPHYYCGEPDDDCDPEFDGLSRRALRSIAAERRVETCDHPEVWRQPALGLVGDGSCLLCAASASTIARALALDAIREAHS